MESQWNPNTNGGKRISTTGEENEYWCTNPQFYLNLKQLTHFKVALTKHKKKQVKEFKVGITLCQPPEMDNQFQDRDKLSKRQLKQALAVRLESNEMPELDPQNLERKMHFRNNENPSPIDSGFLNEKTACLYFKKHHREGPFVIVPQIDKNA